MWRWAIGIVVIIALVAALGVQQTRRMQRIEKEQREAALRDALADLRGAIAKYQADRGRYPQSLQELVPHYLRAIPADPITNSSDWRLTTEETVTPSGDFTAASAPKSETVLVNVHSSAPGYANY